MEIITFTIDPNGAPVSVSLPAASWDVKRRYVRARYNYVNGGTDSYYKSQMLLFSFEWGYLNDADLSALQSILDAISVDGKEVQLNAVAGKTYDRLIDIDDDESYEDAGLTFRKRGIETSFITRVAT